MEDATTIEINLNQNNELIDVPVQGAIATFLFRVMPVDGETHPSELDRLMRILSDDFGLDADATKKLVAEARERKVDDDSLEEMARLLRNQVPHEDLVTLISHMWEMVFADGLMHETEIFYVERVAQLLQIPQREVAKAMQL